MQCVDKLFLVTVFYLLCNLGVPLIRKKNKSHMFAFDLIFEIIKGSFATEKRQICPRYAIHVYWYLFRTYRTYYSIYPFRKLARFSLFYLFSLFNEIKFSLFVYLRTTLYPLLSSFMGGGGGFLNPPIFFFKGF